MWLIEPNVYSDERGYFMEAFKKEEFEAKIGPVDFVQDNESKSSFGVLRGLHYQKGEYSQAKLVRVLKGKVLDVAVDLRRSPSRYCYLMMPLDLHVLSLSLAFILSQDQTLRCMISFYFFFTTCWLVTETFTRLVLLFLSIVISSRIACFSSFENGLQI